MKFAAVDVINLRNDEGLNLVAQTCADSVSTNSLKQLEYLIVQKHVQVNVTDLMGCTPLHHLIEQSKEYPRIHNEYRNGEYVNIHRDYDLEKYNSHNELLLKMAKLLIDHGVDVNKKTKKLTTCLSRAIVHKNVEMVKLLLDAGADISQPSLLTGQNILHDILAVATSFLDISTVLTPIIDALGLYFSLFPSPSFPSPSFTISFPPLLSLSLSLHFFRSPLSSHTPYHFPQLPAGSCLSFSFFPPPCLSS